MTKMLKKIILIICTILICMFIGTISSEAITSSQLSTIKSLGRKAIGKTYNIPGYQVAGTNSERIKKLWCVQHNKGTWRAVSPKYTIIYYIEITGRTATLYGASGKIKSSTNNYNAQMAYILSTGVGHGPWEGTTEHQKALWLVWNNFNNSLGGKMPETSVKGVPTNNSIYTKAKKYTTNITNNSIGVTDSTDEESLKQYENGRIGPFEWKFTGNATINSIEDNKGNTLYIYDENGAKTTDLISETKYYIGCDENTTNITNITNITVSIKNTAETPVKSAKIWYLKTEREDIQNLIYSTTSESSTSEDFSYSYKVNQGSIKVIKVDTDTDESLTGMKFSLYYEYENEKKYVTLDGEYVDKYDSDTCDFEIIDSDGLEIKGLKYGKYTITEIEAPEGYELQLQTETCKEIILNGENSKVDVTISNKKYGSLRLIKVDSETGEPIEGIAFRIKDENGEYIKKYTEGQPSEILTTTNINEACSFETNSDGIIELNNIPTGTYSYEEDTNTMINAGYSNEKGESEGTTGEITVVARDNSNNYASVLYNILNSKYFRSKIVKNKLTSIDVAQRIYNAIMELIGSDKDFKLKDENGDYTEDIDLIIERISLNATEINENVMGLDGDTVAQTAVNVANRLYSTKSDVKNVVISNYGNLGGVWNGPLAVSLAARLNAPLLLEYTGTITSETKEEILSYTNLETIYVVSPQGERVTNTLNEIVTKLNELNNNIKTEVITLRKQFKILHKLNCS